jgi:hypothetical protein
MKSCRYVFGGETVESKLGSHAGVEVECDEAGDHIEVKLTALKFKCTSVPAQEVSGVHYEDGESAGVAEISVETSVTGLESTTTNSIACPTESGGTEEHTDGSYVGEVTVKAHNDATEPVPLARAPGRNPPARGLGLSHGCKPDAFLDKHK